MVRKSIGLFSLLLMLGGCGGGGGAVPGLFGLETRVIVAGLAFPTSLPQPGALQRVRAFPALGFDRPLVLTWAPDGSDRLFVVEQIGRIRVFPNVDSIGAAGTFLDISARVNSGGEEGLLGLAFDPGYATNGFFYVYYSAAFPRRSVLARFSVTADPDVADPASETVLLTIPQPFSNHNGGCLAFGPDGRLYVASGDGGSGNDPGDHAQNLGDLLGKILRLDPSGAIPPDNPFVGTAGARAEIWAYGLRNPWRFSFDRNTGALWAGDVGQDAVEEINIIERGRNYGWRVYEGDRSNINPGALPASGFAAPVHTYSHALGQSVTGGHVYRGSRLPSLFGAYLYGDFMTGRIWALVHDGTRVVSNAEVATVPNPSSFGEDRDGELYVCSFDGGIYRFASASGGTAFPQHLSETGLFDDTAALVPAPGLIEYDVNAPLWSDGATKRRWIALPGSARVVFRATGAWTFPVGTVLVKHFELALAPGVARRVETRVFVNHAQGWNGYTYRWNASETDADLLPDRAGDTFTVADPLAPGGVRQQEWTYPSRADCLACHTGAAGRILGVHTRQMQRTFPYPAREDNQLRAWNHIRLFTTDIGEGSAHGAMPDPDDALLPVAARARAYLDANCANCHRPGSPVALSMDLRFETLPSLGGTLLVPAVNPVGGIPGAVRITPGSKEASDLWQRLRRLDGFRMPPVGSHRQDDAAVDLLGGWIDGGARDG